MIRKATDKDLEDILTISYIYYKEANMSKCSFDYGRLKDSIIHAIHSDDATLLLSDRNGEIVGICFLEKAYPIFSNDCVVDVSIVYVLPDYRGSGVSLIKYIDKIAKEWNAKYIALGVSSGINTERTSQLYKKLGYENIGMDFRKEVV
jgi:GNAT superfamily N-acetyltransferase